MEFNQYNTTVQQWIHTVLENRETNADVVLECCRDIIAYGRKTDDPKLMGFGFFYGGEIYYELNDGAHFFHMMTEALTYLDRAEEWELVVRCYNFLGIASMSRGNPSLALDYYMNGLKDSDTYDLPMQKIMILINMGLLYLECGHYVDSENSFLEAYQILQTKQKDEKYNFYMYAFYGNMAECLILQDRLQEAKPYLEYLHKDGWEQVALTDRLFIDIVDVIYYHKMGDVQKRNESIQMIHQNLPDNLTVLDFFSDYYRCCLVLLETDQDESFWRIIEVIEPQVVNFKIINLQLKVLSLKMKFYRKHNQNAEYLQAAGLYYELSERNEAVTRNMLSSMITLRKNLENMRKARMKAERKNYGHQEGDRCLVSIANTIRNLVEEAEGFCARYGGDEFVIIYANVTREQAVSFAEELRRRVLALEIEHRFSKALPVVTISQGICWGIPRKGNRSWDFLHAADNMLYRVKKFSRNNYCVGGLDETEDVTMGTAL